MQKVKRLRVFSGPNGSGKSTLFTQFSKNYPTGIFVNADLIEKELNTNSLLNLENYNIYTTGSEWKKFLKKKAALSLIKKSTDNNHPVTIAFKENFIVCQGKNMNSYEASLVSLFIREKLMKLNEDFCFETVMSHPSKLAEIQNAKKQGYKTYLYFIATDDPEINISRVENRVRKGGHTVSKNKITDRYFRTMDNLFPAIEICDKSYLFDNSGEELKLIAELYDGAQLKLQVDEAAFPNWFKQYVLTHFI